MSNLPTFALAHAAGLLTWAALQLMPTAALAQSASTVAGVSTSANVSAEQPLEEVIITGSLIPQAGAIAAVPVTVITADDLVNKGYLSLADAVQGQVYSTGSIQNAQTEGSFTPGAQTLSMFGLSPSYTKYLIDGLPMSDYPALYNGTDIINNISGVPEDLIDHVDMLPGGQSSLYGSDAIAGVVNIVMKKHLDEPVIRARLGGYKEGGGTDRRITAAAGHTFADTLSVMGGLEYEKVDPVWGYQRHLTGSYFNGGLEPAVPERDWLLYAPYSGYQYYFTDPSNCTNLSSQFWNSTAKQTRADRGDYCGTLRSGENTIGNGTETTSGYLHATADLQPFLQLYADGMIDHEQLSFSYGGQYWDTTNVSPQGVYYDPNIDDFVGMQHYFSPEESGGLSNTLSSFDSDAWRGTVGARGRFDQSRWSYDLGFSYMEYRLTKHTALMLAAPLDGYYNAILGPDLGPDPYGFGIPTYKPDYAKFYSPVSVSQYASMSTHAVGRSLTEDSMLRGQLTNASLFDLAGGPAGIALVAESGSERWYYHPDPRIADGIIWNTVAVSGDGRRSRYALTGELRLPVQKWLSITGSTRYDSYSVSGERVDANTYNLGAELWPAPTWLLRGRVGTAFRMPSLSDQYQGPSSFYSGATDYYYCYLQGQASSNCDGTGYTGFTSGNTRLQPIRASVSSVGTVWAPSKHARVSLDYLHWNISNEVQLQDANQVLLLEDQCRRGILDIHSPTCVATLAQVVRDPANVLVSIDLPKVNVANETVNAFVAEGRYDLVLGAMGDLEFEAAWSDMLTHTVRPLPGDPAIDLLAAPTWSSEFKSKINGSVTWSFRQWTGTIYAERHGASPNYAAMVGDTAAGSLHPWTVTNLTLRYLWSHDLECGFSVQNVFNVMPPLDRTQPGTTSSPFNDGNYDVYGMSYFGYLTYQFK